MLTRVYLALNDAAPSSISQLVTKHSSRISLIRGRRKLVIPSVNTTKYGLLSLPDSIHVSTSLAAFKAGLETLDLDKESCSFCDEY